MMSRVRRAGLAMLAAIGAAFATPSGAWANQATEAYVAENAPAALAALSAPGLSEQARAQRFAQLMDRFADMPLIANFVLGRYARELRADPQLRAEWNAAFREYAVAVYQDQLDQYRGQAVRVIGSQDTTINGRFYSVVSTEMARAGAAPFRVQWRLVRQGEAYRVVDVAVRLEESTIWLAQQQRRDFEAELDRNGGDVRDLIGKVRQMTSEMRARIAQRARARTG